MLKADGFSGLDFEGRVSAGFGRMLLDGTYRSQARPALEQRGEARELFLRTRGVSFHAAIVEIADIPGQAQFQRGALREIAESHPLHSPVYKPAPRIS